MPDNRELYDQAMREANSAAWDQQWNKAIAAYRRALDELPDDNTALTNLGLTLLATGQIEEALAVYQRAARLNPKDPVAVAKCGELFERLGRKAEAAQTYQVVAELYLTHRDVLTAIEYWARCSFLNPNNLQPRSRLALAYERTGKTKEAVAEYLGIARLMQRHGDLQKALQAAQHAAQLDPRSQDALNAIDMIQRGLTIPEVQRPKIEASAALSAQGSAFGLPEVAKDTPARVEAEKKDSPLESARRQALAALAQTLFDIGEDSGQLTRPVRTTGILKKPGTDMLRDARSHRAQIIGNLGQAIDLQTKGDLNAAAAFYEKTLRAGLEHAALRFALGTVYLDLERYQDAIKQLLPAADHHDYAPGAHFALGLCYGREGKMKNAVDHLLNCLRIVDLTTVPEQQADPLSARYETLRENTGRDQTDDELTQLGENLIAFLSGADWQERLQRARKQLNEQQDGVLAPLADMLSVPGTERVMESMALIEKYMALDRLETAMDEAHHAIEFAPTYLPAHIKMAEILMTTGRTEDAIAKYKVVADVYRVRGDAARAGRIYEQMVRLSPLDLDLRARAINLLTSQGRIEEAINQYIDMAEAHKDLADIEKAQQTYADALLLAQGPGGDRTLAARVLHLIGDLDIQRLDWRQALRVYEQIRNLNPADEKARSTLIDLNFRLGQSQQAITETDDMIRYFGGSGHLQPAAAVLDEQIRNHPDEIELRSRLARLYQELGRKNEAIAQLDAIGEIQLQDGRRADAVKTIQAIIALGPEDGDGYRQLLADLQSSN